MKGLRKIIVEDFYRPYKQYFYWFAYTSVIGRGSNRRQYIVTYYVSYGSYLQQKMSINFQLCLNINYITQTILKHAIMIMFVDVTMMIFLQMDSIDKPLFISY